MYLLCYVHIFGMASQCSGARQSLTWVPSNTSKYIPHNKISWESSVVLNIKMQMNKTLLTCGLWYHLHTKFYQNAVCFGQEKCRTQFHYNVISLYHSNTKFILYLPQYLTSLHTLYVNLRCSEEKYRGGSNTAYSPSSAIRPWNPFSLQYAITSWWWSSIVHS